MLKFIKGLARKKLVIGSLSVILALAMALSGVHFVQTVDYPLQIGSLTVGIGRPEIVVGFGVEAAGTADYTCDGIRDYVQFDSAIAALPANGGKISVLAGAYVWTDALTTVNVPANVSIEGVGLASSFTGDGVTPLFTAVGNNCTFSNLRTDAGSIGMGATTGWMWTNIYNGATYYAYRSPYGQSIFNDATVASLTDSGLTSGRIPIAGVGGLLGDDADLTFTGGDTMNVTKLLVTGGIQLSDNQDIFVQGGGNVHFGNRSGVLEANQTNLRIEPIKNADVGEMLIDSNKIYFIGSYWSGGIANDTVNELFFETTNVTPYGRYVFEVPQATPIMYLGNDVNGAFLGSQENAGAYLRFMAFTTGGTLTEVARLSGAASPTFDIKAGKLTGSFNVNSQSITGVGTVNFRTDASSYFITAANSTTQLLIRRTAANSGIGFYIYSNSAADADRERLYITSGVDTATAGWSNITHTGIIFSQGSPPKFSDNATGGGVALVGANCPATNVTAPYVWITVKSSDGSTVYVPGWK